MTQKKRRRVTIYKRFERFWHWCQALLIAVLAVTGFDIHYDWGLMNFGTAVELHRLCAWAFVILVGLSFFWHFTTGEWRHYIPMPGYTRAMIHYYLVGIFKGEPHPFRKTQLSKLNPLQRLAYLSLTAFAIPVTVITGFLYYYYNEWPSLGLGSWSLKPVALIHTLAAFGLVAFMIGHVYLTTTGHTIFSNLKAMITGWEEIEEDEEEAQN